MDFNEFLLIGGAVVAGASLLSAWVLYLKFFIVVPPNQALVIFGRGRILSGAGESPGRSNSRSGPRIVVGGGAFVSPWGKGHGFLPLHTLDVDVLVHTTTPVGPALSRGWEVRLGVQAKIPTDAESLRTAAENLLGKSEEELKQVVRRAVEGYVPTVLAKIPEAEIDNDWDRIGAEIQSYAATDLVGLGLVIRSLTIKQIAPGGIGDSSILVPESSYARSGKNSAGSEASSPYRGLEAPLGSVERSLEVLGPDSSDAVERSNDVSGGPPLPGNGDANGSARYASSRTASASHASMGHRLPRGGRRPAESNPGDSEPGGGQGLLNFNNLR